MPSSTQYNWPTVRRTVKTPVEWEALVAEESDTKLPTMKQEPTTDYGVSIIGEVLENGIYSGRSRRARAHRARYDASALVDRIGL